MLHDVAEPVNSAEQVQHWAEMDDGRMVPPVDALKRWPDVQAGGFPCVPSRLVESGGRSEAGANLTQRHRFWIEPTIPLRFSGEQIPYIFGERSLLANRIPRWHMNVESTHGVCGRPQSCEGNLQTD